MKAFLTLLIPLVALYAHGQRCTQLNGKDINCIDREGFKQGYWEYAAYEPSATRGDGDAAPSPVRIGVKSRGSYLDDRKVGTWEYFMEAGTPNARIEKSITYFDNGSSREHNVYWEYDLVRIPNGPDLRGQLIYREDVVDFTCDLDSCRFFVDGKHEFTRNARAALDFELDKYRLGLYREKIAAMRKE